MCMRRHVRKEGRKVGKKERNTEGGRGERGEGEGKREGEKVGGGEGRDRERERENSRMHPFLYTSTLVL